MQEDKAKRKVTKKSALGGRVFCRFVVVQGRIQEGEKEGGKREKKRRGKKMRQKGINLKQKKSKAARDENIEIEKGSAKTSESCETRKLAHAKGQRRDGNESDRETGKDGGTISYEEGTKGAEWKEKKNEKEKKREKKQRGKEETNARTIIRVYMK
jgi:hypothetical protein